MKIIDKWWISFVIYTIALIILVTFEIIKNYSSYSFYFTLASAILLFISVVFQLIKRRWLDAAIGSALSFGITVMAIVLIFMMGALNTLSGGTMNAFDEQYYKDRFEENTKIGFPSTAHFITKDESIPSYGFENEYDARCLIKLDIKDYQEILKKIGADPSFKAQKKSIEFGPDFTDEKINSSDFTSTFVHDNPGYSWYTISFHENKEIIAFEISIY